MRLSRKAFHCLILCLSYADVAFSETPIQPSLYPTCSSLSASGNAEYPPFLWRETSTSKELNGVNRLIIDEVSRRIGIPIKVIYTGSWSQAQTEVKNGRIDIMAGAFYTNERANYMDYFTPVMLHTTSVVWQNKDNSFPFHKKEDLEGKWGVTVINNSFGQEFDQYVQRSLNILTVASLSQALHMLAADRVDYVLYEKAPADAYASLLGLSEHIFSVSPFISSEGLYLTMSKKSHCNTAVVKHHIALALQGMKNDGFTEQALIDGEEHWEKRKNQNRLIK